MTVTRSSFLILLAVVLFAVALVLVLVDSTNAKVVQLLLYGGLTSFAAGHLPG